MSRTAARFKVGRSGANSEPGTPEVGLENLAFSVPLGAHLGGEGDESHPGLFSNPDSYCGTCCRPHSEGCSLHPPSFLLLSEFPPHFHLPRIKERQFLSGGGKADSPRA